MASISNGDLILSSSTSDTDPLYIMTRTGGGGFTRKPGLALVTYQHTPAWYGWAKSETPGVSDFVYQIKGRAVPVFGGIGLDMMPINLPATALILTSSGAQLVAQYGDIEYLVYVWPDSPVDNILWPIVAGRAGEIQSMQIYNTAPCIPHLDISTPIQGQEFIGLPGTYIVDFILNQSATPLKIVLQEQDANNRLELRKEYDGSNYMLKLYRLETGVSTLHRYLSSAVVNGMHVLIQMRTPLQFITASGDGHNGLKCYSNGYYSGSTTVPPFSISTLGRFETLPDGMITNFRMWNMILQ